MKMSPVLFAQTAGVKSSASAGYVGVEASNDAADTREWSVIIRRSR